MDISALPFGGGFECECGRRHTIPIRRVLIEHGVLERIPQEIDKLGIGRGALVVADLNTYEAAGEAIVTSLRKARFRCSLSLFKVREGLVPDERSVIKVLNDLDGDIDFLVAVGSGTINDLTRYVSSKVRRPYVSVPTAPSMDGYTSTVSPMFFERFKTTYPAICPLGVYCDLDVLTDTPPAIIRAGFGDLVGKLTARVDWILSKTLNDEYYCPYTVELVHEAVAECMRHAEDIRNSKPNAVRLLIEGLLLSGIGILLVGNSRPASGAEHLMAHFWEIASLNEGRKGAFHGAAVGVASVTVARIYERLVSLEPWAESLNNSLRDDLQRRWEAFLEEARPILPSSNEVTGLLEAAGAATTPAQLGISAEWVREAVLHARELRKRFTVLNLAYEWGLLNSFAEEEFRIAQKG